MTDRRRRRITGREALEEIDLRLGGLFGELTETLGRLADAGATDGRGLKIESEMRVRVGGLDAGGPRDRPGDAAGGSRDPGGRPDAPAGGGTREPAVEIFDEPECWTLTAELPGIAPGDLDVAVEGGALRIRATGARRFETRVDVPSAIDPATLEIRLANGILEVRAAKPGTGSA